MMTSAMVDEERARRRRAVAELFTYMRNRGIKRTWLAEQLGISKGRIFHYEHDLVMAPEWFLLDACKALEVAPEKFGWSTRARRTHRRAS